MVDCFGKRVALGVEAARVELGELLDQIAKAGGFELDLGACVELDEGKLALVVQSDGDDLIQGNCSGLFQCVRELNGLHLDSPREK